MRIWTSGHRVPVTVRLATLDLVGSQWRKSEDVAEAREIELRRSSDAELTTASINNEENAEKYAPPLSAIISQTRLPTGGVQDAREQALVLKVEDLEPQQQRAIFKAYNQGLDLLKYDNLRMGAHLDGELADGTDLARLPEAEARGKVRLFVRLGASETTDYYEYEQPLSPSPPTPPTARPDPELLWLPDLNEMNLELSALNQLKEIRNDLVGRDGLPVSTDSLLWSDDPRYRAELSDLDEEVGSFAPPGARIGIKGTPSLGRINTIVIGVRNGVPFTETPTSEEVLRLVNVWVNELRVAGYDETNGWSALANADVVLADVGRMKASYQTQTDGFGSLASTLGERDQEAIQNWGVNADVGLHKLVPERYGWNIPVSAQVQSNTSTPRFAPSRGDVRLEEILRAIERRSDLSEAQQELRKAEAIREAQDYSFRRSFTASLSKTGSESRLLRNTVDGLALSYSFSDTDARSPTLRLRDGWNWSGTTSYTFSARPKTVRPLWFLGSIPLVGLLGDLTFNYVPQSLSLSGSLARTFSESQDRPRDLQPEAEASPFPDLVEHPLRQQHAFNHRRNFRLQYNPLQFLSLGFETNTSQDLNEIGADTLHVLVARDTVSGGDLPPIPLIGPSRQEAEAAAAAAGYVLDETAFVVSQLDVVPANRVASRIASGLYPRTDQYGQRFTATLRPTFGQGGALDWITFQDLSYNAQYSWQNGAAGRPTGATVSNQMSYDTGVTLRPEALWQKFGLYRRLEEAQRQAEQEAQDERQRREQERQARREERRREKERRRQGERGAEVPEEEELPETSPEAFAPEPAEADSLRDDRSGFRLPLPNPRAVLRRFVLALTGVENFAVTFSGDRSARSSAVGYLSGPSSTPEGGTKRTLRTPYTFYDRFSGEGGPSLYYRFGLKRQIADNQRVFGSLQVQDILQDGNRVTARTSLNPSTALQISLNWNADWSQTTNLVYPERGVPPTTTQTGENRASVWAFGASFQTLFDRQYATYQADLGGRDPADLETLGDANGDERVVLANESVVGDFQQAFIAGLGPVDGEGFLPFPMPGWLVNYTGLSDWPILRRLTQSVTLQHGYSADYATSYETVGILGSGETAGFDFDVLRIVYRPSDYQADRIRINERFQPLIGVDVLWKGQVQTRAQWNTSNAYAITASSSTVTQQKTSELSLTASYQKQGPPPPLHPAPPEQPGQLQPHRRPLRLGRPELLPQARAGVQGRRRGRADAGAPRGARRHGQQRLDAAPRHAPRLLPVLEPGRGRLHAELRAVRQRPGPRPLLDDHQRRLQRPRLHLLELRDGPVRR